MHNPKLSKILTRTSFNLCFIITLALATWLGLVSPALAQGPIIRVTLDGNPTADGSDWSNATVLTNALSIASPGAEIWVATGVYTAGLKRSDTFNLPAGVALYGGFNPAGGADEFNERDWAANPTILSGDIGGDDTTDATGVVTTTAAITGSNAFHVLHLNGTTSPITESTIIDGFTITAGQANGDNVLNYDGGGLYCNGRGSGGECSPQLTNITFSGNRARRNGAMYNDGSIGGESSPRLTNVTFSGNSASQGGAMYNNGYDGGVSSPSLANVTFASNSANYGGAMHNEGTVGGESSPRLTNVTFSGNSASNGGAIYNEGYDGGVSSPSLTNVIMWGNTATDKGKQLYNINATPVLSYTLIQSGTNDIVNDPTFGGSVDYGDGILTVDPLFVDAAAGDLRLQGISPAIDAGDNSAIGLATDLAGQPRKVDNPLVADTGLGLAPLVDMGAYENQDDCPPTNPIYVNRGVAGSNNGGSWTNAFTDLQNGLSAARLCAGLDEIWVASGVYTPGLNQSDTFSLPAGVALYGGFGGITETQRTERDWAAYPTVLSGDIGGDDTTDANGVVITTTNIVGDNAYHVLYLDGTTGPITASTIIDGFTITAGRANLRGGGLYCNGEESGGQCSPSLTNVIFAGNWADFGGAMFNYGRNSGISSPSLTNVIFTGNAAGQYGGAMYNFGRGGVSSPSLTNVTFAGNAADYGGAMTNNGRNGDSSGESSPHLTNVIMWGNTATISGTQLYNYGTGATPVLSYTLIQSSTNDIVNDPTERGNVDYRDGILTSDPRFVDAAGGNLQLLPGSPAIDSGTDKGAPAFDIRGLPRPANRGVDRGAYEMQSSNTYLPLIIKQD